MAVAGTQPTGRSPLRRLRGLGGAFRSSQARALGISPRTLAHLRGAGHLEQLSRGVFRLTSLPYR